ncbi:MepB family protein [Neolewinella aurantiaca]|uniref:MepB family protein n=1 Tax=Neolewinella aurantiaca TaxID=2602767 RepID=A0A5C7F452_9BACT|nr:MepB family protein [Neolewinella aurantiaca]TXF82573.1 MepB family protein [Neolewinella aurantiaca]
MNEDVRLIKKEVYEKCRLVISEYKAEGESQDYSACRFRLNGLRIVCRNSKITPKKVGQFVTFWKRSIDGVIEPLDESDQIDFYVVNVRTENKLGQFVFPKSILIEKGIMSTNEKEGKRGFRVYSIWDTPQNGQAKKTQKWQLNYFFEINEEVDLEKVIKMYHLN